MELGSLRVVPFSLLMRVWGEVGAAIEEGWGEERVPVPILLRGAQCRWLWSGCLVALGYHRAHAQILLLDPGLRGRCWM